MRDAKKVRTTLNLEDDVYAVARSLAKQRRVSMGEVISELSRRGLQNQTRPAAIRNGLRLFPQPADRTPVTMELVKKLLEETD